MKIAYLTAPYSSYLRAKYAETPLLDKQPFAEQHRNFVTTGYNWIGAWEPEFNRLGYEVLGVFANAEAMQRAWARENGVALSLVGWQQEVAAAQLIQFQPSILLLDDVRGFDGQWLRELRAQCSSLRVIIGSSGSPSHDIGMLKQCSIVLSCSRDLVLSFRNSGCNAIYFHHAVNEHIIRRLAPRIDPIHQIFFAGSVVRAAGYHLKRETLLESLVAASLPLCLHCPQYSISSTRDFIETSIKRVLYSGMQSLALLGVSNNVRRNLPFVGRAANWTGLPMSQINTQLRRYMQPALYGQEMLAAMRQSAIALNIHLDSAGVQAANVRLFEGAGVGACLLTDWKDDLPTLFDLDRELVVYKSFDECLEKARWLLGHDVEREQIALAGQKRVLREHTYARRAEQLHSLIRELHC